MRYLILLFLFLSIAHADEFGLRLGSAISPQDTSIVSFPSGGGNGGTGTYDGKAFVGVYDWEPHDNFYLEGALGYRSPSDIFEYSSMLYELSPGFRVTWGALVLKLSEGMAYMPQNSFDPVTYDGYNKWDLVTHISVGLRDPKTGIGIYFDRSHYSNGNELNNPSLNYEGFMLLFPTSIFSGSR